MPRFRRARPTLDYGHLAKPLPLILQEAIDNRTYGQHSSPYPAEVNACLIELFAGRDKLGEADLLDAVERVRPGRGWSSEFRMDVVGNWIGWGLHLSLLRETPDENGSRGWTMPDREPHFDLDNNRARRIRGLEPLAQLLMDKRRMREAKLRKTLARKHAAKIAPVIEADLSRLTDLEPDAVIPDDWRRFVGEDVLAKWPRVREAHGLLKDLHWDWSRDLQEQWRGHVGAEADMAAYRAQRRRMKEERAAEAMLAEDDAALAEI